jgi:hypothetical protein
LYVIYADGNEILHNLEGGERRNPVAGERRNPGEIPAKKDLD